MKRYLQNVTAFLAISLLHTPVFSATDDLVIMALFRDKAVVRMDNRQYSLSPGDTIGNGIRFVSATSSVAIFEINGEQHWLGLGSHIGSQYREDQPQHTVTIAADRQGMFEVTGSINRHHTSFIVDTGATLVAMNRNHARYFGIDYKMTGRQSISSTAAGLDTVYLVTLDSVRVGDIQLRNIRAAVHDGDFPEKVLLGNSFLNQVSIQRDGLLLRLTR